MKNTQKCPKCDSSEIIRITGKSSAKPYYRAGNYIDKGSLFTKHNLLIYVTRYLCGMCGYTEEWIDNKKDIQEIKEKIASFSSERSEPEYLDDDGFDETPPWKKKPRF